MSDEHQAATNPKAIDPAELADLKRAFPHLHLPIPIGTERKASEIAGIRYSVESVLSIGDPVHETITERALRNTGLIAAGETYSDRAAWDFTRGVFWNDDPEGLLFQPGAEALPFSGPAVQ